MLFRYLTPLVGLCGAAAALPWSPKTPFDAPSFAPVSSGSSLGSLQLPIFSASSAPDVQSPESASLSYWAPVWSPFSSKPLPLIIWHGLGDSAFSPNLAELKSSLEEAYPGLYVYLIPLGTSLSEDRNRGVFGNVVEDVAQVCEDLQHVEELSSGGVIEVDAMGFSQGGQFLRALVQTCEPLKVRNLVTLGSQHMVSVCARTMLEPTSIALPSSTACSLLVCTPAASSSTISGHCRLPCMLIRRLPVPPRRRRAALWRLYRLCADARRLCPILPEPTRCRRLPAISSSQ